VPQLQGAKMNLTKTFLSLRFRIAVILSISLMLLWGIAFSSSTMRSSAQGREFKIKTFKDMPVAVHQVKKSSIRNLVQ
jgi:hypothetical protein